MKRKASDVIDHFDNSPMNFVRRKAEAQAALCKDLLEIVGEDVEKNNTDDPQVALAKKQLNGFKFSMRIAIREYCGEDV